MGAPMNKIFTPLSSEEKRILYDDVAVSLSDLLGNEEPIVATNPKYDIKDNLFEPEAIHRYQNQDNLANVALMNNNPNERLYVKDNYLSSTQMINNLFSNLEDISCLEFLSEENTYYSAEGFTCPQEATLEEIYHNEFETLIPQFTTNNNDNMQVINPVVFGSKYEIQDNSYAPIATTCRNQITPANVALINSNPMECEWTNPSTENPLPPNISNAFATVNPLPPKDVTQSPIHIVGEDNTSTRKRAKPELVEEGGACKRCTCKKSKCLKLYCECFLNGVYCKEPCLCQDCFNKPSNEVEVQQARQKIDSRYKHANDIRSSNFSSQIEDDLNRTLPFKLPNRGCTCKTSKCVMKYCHCYKGGVGCSPSCKCQGCENTYGRNDTKVEEIEAIDNVALPTIPLHISSQNQEIVEESQTFCPQTPQMETMIVVSSPTHSGSNNLTSQSCPSPTAYLKF